ncbi:hypothetical protein QQS21_010192 [Conoideocrella luteorostrata]|uniref:Uncharacterized protein n=1 Tax=Conoideocrella luteorostrata TaxID=1105319 RepID=A0AAJ0FPM5_9HYPO|nr:hypothetical protein QQS21_010192 [Conoideocrella luteorostrata]
MRLDVKALGLAHIGYVGGTVQIPTETDGNYNWTQLQAALRWSVVNVTPSVISLYEASTKDPSEPALTLTINVKQLSPARDQHPLTICTANTILGEGDPSLRLLMRNSDRATKYLLGDSLPGINMQYAELELDDWKTELPFATVPPGAEGLTVTRAISWERLLQHRGKAPSLDKQPQPGDEYELYFAPGRLEPFTDWWNWGDLDGDLKDRKLVNLVNPSLNGVKDPALPLPPTLLPFDAWGEGSDDSGNDFVRLLIILDTTPILVKFVN